MNAPDLSAFGFGWHVSAVKCQECRRDIKFTLTRIPCEQELTCGACKARWLLIAENESPGYTVRIEPRNKGLS
jgi:hypothetical protein